MTENDTQILNDTILLKKFNNRDDVVFSEVYISLFDELYYFTNKLFNGENISTEDFIQDVFIYIWENKKLCFKSLGGVKAYIYVSIKHRYIKHLSHQKCIDKYNILSNIDDRFVTSMVENEIVSALTKSAELLPTDCAEVFRLCIEGWEVKEIAEKLNKPETTIYKQRTKAIKILQTKLTRKDLLVLLTIFMN